MVELGCGTGINFPLLHAAVGEEGQITGVDLTAEMLDQARVRGKRNALTLSPEFDAVIERAGGTLGPRGGMALLGLKRPPWPDPLVHLVAWLNRPFAVTVDLGERHA